jgi:hypothetical protein
MPEILEFGGPSEAGKGYRRLAIWIVKNISGPQAGQDHHPVSGCAEIILRGNLDCNRKS